MSASDRTRAAGRRRRATRPYTGTQSDDYTGTPGKKMAKPTPRRRPTGVAGGNARRRGQMTASRPSRKK